MHAYGDTDPFALAAAYSVALARNHPFVDGNKRIAFMAAYVFLARNGYRPTMSETDTVTVMLELAANEIDESALADWLRRNCAEPG